MPGSGRVVTASVPLSSKRLDSRHPAAVPPRTRATRGGLDPGVRERAAHALDEDWPEVLAALRRGLKDQDARKAAAVAVSYVQLVYGRQLQTEKDEAAPAELDVASMTIEQRNRLKQRLLAQNPELAHELAGDEP